MLLKNNKPQIGIINTRKCPYCGHHEVGFITMEGDFQPLKPGTRVQILEGSENLSSFPIKETDSNKSNDQETGSESLALNVWLPKFLQSHKKLRLKYGVLIHSSLLLNPIISGEIYQMAYLAKLRQLIANTIHIPLAVILDRFFTSPQLASGNPRQVTEALWQEFEEIRKPVLLMQAWLAKQDEENLAKLIHPLTVSELGDAGVDDEQLRKELSELTLESFFESLRE